MVIYYLDNFRSFFDTKIEFGQVNFLIGENSTGKTSLMSLLNMLNTLEFWIRFDFNTESISLGSFEDILSIKSKKKSFTVGMYYQGKSSSQRKTLRATMYLLNFEDDNGMATPIEITIFSDDLLLTVQRHDQKVQYKFKEFPQLIDAAKSPSENFDNILEEINKKQFVEKRFVTFDNDIDPNTPITLIPSDIARKNDKLKNRFEGFQPFPLFIRRTSWFAPIRCKPKPFYQSIKSAISPEGDHTPFILKNMYRAEQKLDEEKKYFKQAIDNFGKESGLYDSINIVSLGSKSTAPFELDIVKNGASYKISTVGYGVSQIFPILIDILAREKGTEFSIQQPEVHLHPKAQASFGELIFQLALQDRKSFIIETHSDFIIDRFRYCLAKSRAKVDAKVFFFEKQNTKNIINKVNIQKSGNYGDSVPDNFRTFFVNESLKMLDL